MCGMRGTVVDENLKLWRPDDLLVDFKQDQIWSDLCIRKIVRGFYYYWRIYIYIVGDIGLMHILKAQKTKGLNRLY